MHLASHSPLNGHLASHSPLNGHPNPETQIKANKTTVSNNNEQNRILYNDTPRHKNPLSLLRSKCHRVQRVEQSFDRAQVEWKTFLLNQKLGPGWNHFLNEEDYCKGTTFKSPRLDMKQPIAAYFDHNKQSVYCRAVIDNYFTSDPNTPRRPTTEETGRRFSQPLSRKIQHQRDSDLEVVAQQQRPWTMVVSCNTSSIEQRSNYSHNAGNLSQQGQRIRASSNINKSSTSNAPMSSSEYQKPKTANSNAVRHIVTRDIATSYSARQSKRRANQQNNLQEPKSHSVFVRSDFGSTVRSFVFEQKAVTPNQMQWQRQSRAQRLCFPVLLHRSFPSIIDELCHYVKLRNGEVEFLQARPNEAYLKLFRNGGQQLISLIEGVAKMLQGLQGKASINKLSVRNLHRLDQKTYVVRDWGSCSINESFPMQKVIIPAITPAYLVDELGNWIVEPELLAPEILTALAYGKTPTPPSSQTDIWSFGCLLVQLLTLVPLRSRIKVLIKPSTKGQRGLLETNKRTSQQILKLIPGFRRQACKSIEWSCSQLSVPQIVTDLVSRMLQSNPVERISPIGVLEALKCRTK